MHVHDPGTLLPALQQEAGEVFTVVNDRLGQPMELVDARGRVALAAWHSGWGTVRQAQRDEGAANVGSPWRLLGQYADAETGLCYTRYRYFDAETGRWLSPDPLGIAGGANLQGFDGAPSVEVDPWGLSCDSPRQKALRKFIREELGEDLRDIEFFVHGTTAARAADFKYDHSRPLFTSPDIETARLFAHSSSSASRLSALVMIRSLRWLGTKSRSSCSWGWPLQQFPSRVVRRASKFANEMATNATAPRRTTAQACTRLPSVRRQHAAVMAFVAKSSNPWVRLAKAAPAILTASAAPQAEAEAPAPLALVVKWAMVVGEDKAVGQVMVAWAVAAQPASKKWQRAALIAACG